MITGFSPSKNDLTLYIIGGFEHLPDLMKRLGQHMTGKSCLYVKQPADVDLNVLREVVERSVQQIANRRILKLDSHSK